MLRSHLPAGRFICILLSVVGIVFAVGGSVGKTATSTNPQSCHGSVFSCEQLVELGIRYPYARLPGSYLFVDGADYPYLKITRHLLGNSVVALPGGTHITVARLLARLGIAGHFDTKIKPVLGYGSNPAPSQLTRKFEDEGFNEQAVIPTLRGRLTGYDVVWSPQFVNYGAIPATLVRSPGTTVSIWVNWLNSDENTQMNGTESSASSSAYAIGTLDGVRLNMPGPKVVSPGVYIDCHGALTLRGVEQSVAAVPAQGRRSNPIDEAQVLRAVFPTLGWRRSVFDLLLANVTSTNGRATRTDEIAKLGRIVPDRHFHATVPCSQGTSKAAHR